MNARERVLWRPGMPSQRCECGAHDKNKNGQRSACGVCVCVCVCVCAMEASAGTLESGVGIDVGLSVVRRRKTLPEAPSRARFLPPQSARLYSPPIIPSPHSIAISTLPAEFSNFPRKLMRPSRASIEIVWLSYPGVGRISGALLSNAAIQVEPRERLRYEVEHHDFGGFRAGREVLHVRRYLDVHQYYRDFVQQVALGVRGLPLPDFPHAVAHVLLQHRWVPLRARLQGGSTRAPSPSPVALSSDP